MNSNLNSFYCKPLKACVPRDNYKVLQNMTREVELKLKGSVKDYRMLNYDDIRRLVRRENSLKNLSEVVFYGVELYTDRKDSRFIIELRRLNTYGVDNLFNSLSRNFDDYEIIPDNKVIRVEATYYYGGSE